MNRHHSENGMSEEHRYDMSSKWVREKIVTIDIEGKPEIHISTPYDFWPEAPQDLMSPEDLFVASALSCYGVSLSGVASRFHAEFTDFHLKATGTLQKGNLGWEFDRILIEAEITVPSSSDAKKMEKVAERAKTYCLVANSMKCPVELEYKILVVSVPTASV
jgi:organic hydroperoxide reductase OsmC/OhrA